MASQLETASTPILRGRPHVSVSFAFLGLAAADIIMKLAGFRQLHQTVRRWPTSTKANNDQETIADVCAAVDRAGRYYLKHALCLQRSAVITCLLRRKGIPALMVIGCRKIPFRGHAWVEVDGLVVNDNPKVQTHYRVLERC
ncbi:MAG TPA: lasso peptide biosynthesis B2 protein [Pyrinomonadaceae bacterium]|nr:lasso peptide biosynthesis B2 protein [Pyrinomonadaceae bacterium]